MCNKKSLLSRLYLLLIAFALYLPFNIFYFTAAAPFVYVFKIFVSLFGSAILDPYYIRVFCVSSGVYTLYVLIYIFIRVKYRINLQKQIVFALFMYSTINLLASSPNAMFFSKRNGFDSIIFISTFYAFVMFSFYSFILYLSEKFLNLRLRFKIIISFFLANLFGLFLTIYLWSYLN